MNEERKKNKILKFYKENNKFRSYLIREISFVLVLLLKLRSILGDQEDIQTFTDSKETLMEILNW